MPHPLRVAILSFKLFEGPDRPNRRLHFYRRLREILQQQASVVRNPILAAHPPLA